MTCLGCRADSTTDHRDGPIPFDAFVDEALYGARRFFTRAPDGARPVATS